MPSTTDMTTDTSSQALARTSKEGGTVSVTKPYLAGAYTAAAKPITAKAKTGCMPVSMKTRPTTLSPFIQAMTRPLGKASEKGPTTEASKT
jgi:hypothetical protein